MAYKIGNNASINDNQDGDFEVIRIGSGNQIIIGGDVEDSRKSPPSLGETAAYFAGGGGSRSIPFGYNKPADDHPNGILDPATTPSVPYFGLVSPGPSAFNDVQKFTFASEGTATTVAELVQHQKFAATGINDEGHGYILGGGAVMGNQAPGSDLYFGGSYGEDTSPPVPFERLATGTAIEKFDFASQVLVALSGPTDRMDTSRFHHGSVDFSDIAGDIAYSAGGYKINPYGPYSGALDTTEKFTFASSTSSSNPATLTSGRYGQYTVQSAEHGYFINGHNRNNTPNPAPGFPPSRVPNSIVLPSVLGVSSVDKIAAASGTITGDIATKNNTDGRSFGASVSSIDYGFIAGGTIAGQRVRDREPGTTIAKWAPPTGAWLDPTNPVYPEATPHTNPPVDGGALSGWLLGYGISHFLSPTPAIMYDYENNAAPPIPVFPAPADSFDGANQSDFNYITIGDGLNNAPGHTGVRIPTLNGMSNPTIAFYNGDRSTFTARDGTEIDKFLYTADQTNPYTGKLYNAHPGGSGSRFQPADDDYTIPTGPSFPPALSPTPYESSDNGFKMTEAGVFWSPAPSAYSRDQYISHPVPYPIQQSEGIPGTVTGDVTWNQIIETSMYSVEWQGPGFPSPTPFASPGVSNPDVSIFAMKTFDLTKRHPEGGYSEPFAVYSNGRPIPLEQSWKGDIITNGLFTNSRFNIEKFPFANSSAPATEVADFQFTGYDFHDWNSDGSPFTGTPTRLGLTGASSTTHGFLAGGTGYSPLQGSLIPYAPPRQDTGFGSSNLRYHTISKFPFAIVTGNSTNVGDLADATYEAASFQE